MAASSPPIEALHNLGELNSESLSEGVSSFLGAMKRRLKHRVALFAEVSFMDYLFASEYVEQSPPSRNRQESYKKYLHELMDDPKPEDEDSPHTPATIVRRRPRNAQPSIETDECEARRIWQHIRKTSRPGEPPKEDSAKYVGDEEAGFGEKHDPHIEEIRYTALKHGRKISTATLRSIAKDLKRRDSSSIEEEEPDDDAD
jgi:hypothetical protein